MKNPNLIFIYTDEQAFNTLAAYGNHRIEMPNLNAFAEESTVFECAYVTQPVCTPSRGSLLTGMWPHAHGAWENNLRLAEGVKCLPEMAAPGAYATAHIGKWHLGDEIYPQHGFDTWAGIEDAYWRFYSEGKYVSDRSSYHRWLTANGFQPENGEIFSRTETSAMAEEFSKTAFVANESIEFVKQNHDKPFILYANFLEPHMPFTGPRDGQYDPAGIPLPANFNALPGMDEPLKHRLYYEDQYAHKANGFHIRTESDWRALTARYWGLCSQVDTYVGRLLSALKQTGCWDNSIIVFTSDHGDMMGSHRLYAKCVMYEEAIRVPMLIKIPGQKGAGRVSGNFSHIDLVPTLLEALGQNRDTQLQGESRLPVLEEAHASTDPQRLENDVFIEWQGCNRGTDGMAPRFPVPAFLTGDLSPSDIERHLKDPFRTLIQPDGWKLTLSGEGRSMLYNLREDPGECQNLFNLPGHRELIQSMSMKIEEWNRKTGYTLQ